MNYVLGLITIMGSIFAVDKLYTWYNKKFEKMKLELEVLKVVAKHECFGKFNSDPAQFISWIAQLLALMGLKVAEALPKQKDSGIDLTGQYKDGRIVYIKCNLGKPENWENPIDKSEAQRLVGAMVEDGVKNGLIITIPSLSDVVKNYLATVKQEGLTIKYMDGDDLVKELYKLRQNKLPEMLDKLGITLKRNT
ncbi:MAG: restriction endonuclease [Peptococcaceae bacterium]|nr:restriction endonuclease [Peptococcaceae bacterium]